MSEFLSSHDYPELLRDESRRQGTCDTVSFPRDAHELRDDLLRAVAAGTRVTVSAARTGLSAAAVPQGGHMISTQRMNHILSLDERDGVFFVTVEPGLTLTALRTALANHLRDIALDEHSRAVADRMRERGGAFFPPDPTEATATIGGMAACNASGACSFSFGATRRFIEGFTALLPDGHELTLTRGQCRARDRAFSLAAGGTTYEGRLPAYDMPPIKNAAGIFATDDADLVDVFVGAEGLLGVFTSLTLRLLPAPRHVFGVTAFFRDDDAAIRFVRRLRGDTPQDDGSRFAYEPIAIEYFDEKSLDLLRKSRATTQAFAGLLPLKDHYRVAVYTELHTDDRSAGLDGVQAVGALAASCGGSEQDSFAALDAAQMERLKFFRHATPESVNLTIDERRRSDPTLTKLGTDMAVPARDLEWVIELYKADIERAGLDAVVFGHIGDNHVHVNILPRDRADYDKGKELYLTWAQQIVARGGTVSAEHGIGKLKPDFLRVMYGEEGLRDILRLKRVFDPQLLLNTGNMTGEVQL